MEYRTRGVEMTDIIRWYGYVVWFYAKQTFNDLPGPRWCKILLIVICVAIPGPWDELALIALVKLCRTIRARRTNYAG
jgi:hypothetical protein